MRLTCARANWTLRQALLVMHSPTDNTVGIANASDIFRTWHVIPAASFRWKGLTTS